MTITVETHCEHCNTETPELFRAIDSSGRLEIEICEQCRDSPDYEICSCGNVLAHRMANVLIHAVDGAILCEECRYDGYETCGSCGNTDNESDCIWVESREETLCDSCADNLLTMCDHCNNRFDNEDIHSDSFGTAVCDACYDNHYCYCECCEAIISYDDSRSTECATYCEECYNEQYFYCQQCETDCDIDSRCSCGNCNDCCECGGTDDDYGIQHTSHSGCERERKAYAMDVSSDIGNYTFPECSIPNIRFSPELEFASSEREIIKGTANTIWDIGTDCTAASSGLSGLEIRPKTSTKLIGKNGLSAVVELLNTIRSAGDINPVVHAGCGFHLHIDCNNISAYHMRRFCQLWANLQEWTYSVISPSRKNGYYSKAVKWAAENVSGLRYKSDIEDYTSTGRYWGLNTSSYSIHSTLEIRAHNGTVNRSKIVNWIIFWLIAFDDCGKMSADWIDTAECGNDILMHHEGTESLMVYFADRQTEFSA